MNKLIAITLLSATLTSTTWAAEKVGSVGVNLSIDNTAGIQGEFNL